MSDRTILIGGGTNKTTTLKKLLEDTYTREKEEFAITELEKIKTEILGQKMFYTPDIDIIDNHIKELKGE